MKTFHTQYGIGKVKFVVSFHDGVSTHSDGSKFSDVRLFSNQKKFANFLAKLRADGYIQEQA